MNRSALCRSEEHRTSLGRDSHSPTHRSGLTPSCGTTTYWPVLKLPASAIRATDESVGFVQIGRAQDLLGTGPPQSNTPVRPDSVLRDDHLLAGSKASSLRDTRDG